MKWKTLKELDYTEGTVQLVNDHDGRVFKLLGGKKANKDIILIPQPSSNPNDPLNWPTWKKNAAFWSICFFVFMGNTCIGGMGPGLQVIQNQYKVSSQEVTTLLSYPVLIEGISNFFWVPAGVYFGRRPVFVLTALLFFLCQVWAVIADSFVSLRASLMVSAVSAGATEGLGAAIVNDLFFLHQRGTHLGIYIVALAWGSSLGPMCAGFMWSTQSLNLFKKVMSGFTAAMFIAIFFLFPETRFHRDSSDHIIAAPESSTEDGEKQVASEVIETEDVVVRVPTTALTVTPKVKFLDELKLWSGTSPGVSFFELFIRPFALIFYPATVWAAVGYSTVLAWVVIVASTNPLLLEIPPYNMSPGVNGLINIASLIGNIVGAVTSGNLADWWVARQARKNHGVFQPETRLIWLLVSLISVPAGCLIYGFGAQYHLHWALIFVGSGLIAVGVTNVPNIGMSYVLDSYSPIASEALLLINGLKNIASFPIILSAIPWVENQGYARAFGTMAGIQVAVLGCVVPLAFWGASIRHYTSNKWKLVCW